MLSSGLVSISFRKLSPEVIIDLVRRSGLDAIEWGGDIHCPHGDTARAMDVAQRTRDAGLRVCAYGSYYRVGVSESEGLAWSSVLDSAQAMGAPLIRVWAGKRDADKADDDYRSLVLQDARRIADAAQAVGIRIGFEYHSGTLTNTDAAAQRLLAELPHPAITTFWQPHVNAPFDESESGLRAVLPHLSNIHVYSWLERNRLPLAARADDWRRWLAIAASTGRDHVCCLEFIKDDCQNQFLVDAATLRKLIAS